MWRLLGWLFAVLRALLSLLIALAIGLVRAASSSSASSASTSSASSSATARLLSLWEALSSNTGMTALTMAVLLLGWYKIGRSEYR